MFSLNIYFFQRFSNVTNETLKLVLKTKTVEKRKIGSLGFEDQLSRKESTVPKLLVIISSTASTILIYSAILVKIFKTSPRFLNKLGKKSLSRKSHQVQYVELNCLYTFLKLRHLCWVQISTSINRQTIETSKPGLNSLKQRFSTWGTRTPGGTRRVDRGYAKLF